MEWLKRIWMSWIRPESRLEDQVFYDLETGVERFEKKPDAVVILVHGTQFLPVPREGVRWTQPGSPLWSTLTSALKGKTVLVHRFRWTGRNTFISRFVARNKLLKVMVCVRTWWPTAPVFLVGHSHGGNVISSAALESLNVAGVICLATPFLCVERRKVHPVYRMAPAIIGGVVGLCVFLISVGWLWFSSIGWIERLMGSSMGTNLQLLLGVVTLTAGSFLAILVAAGPIYGAATTLRIFHHAARRHIFTLTRPPRVRPEKVVFIRGIGDEASFALSAAHMAGRLLDFVSKILFSFCGVVGWFGRGLEAAARLHRAVASLTVLAFAFALPLFLLWLGDLVPWLQPAVQACFLLVYTLVGMIPLLALVAVASWFIGGTILSLAFGPEMMLIGPTFRLSAESSPPGCWQVATFKRSDPSGKRTTALAHSHVYENQHVLDYMANWILSRF